MHQNALFFEIKWKIAVALRDPPPNPPWLPAAGGSAPDPRVVNLITCYSYFSKAFVALTSLLSKRNKKNLEVAIMFCFYHSFVTSNSAQGTLANATGLDFRAS